MSNFHEHWSDPSRGAGSAFSQSAASTAGQGADFSWIHGLAKGEQNPEADRLLQAAGGIDPQQRIEEATVDFLTRLRESFTEYCRIFNGYSEAGSRFQEIKVYLQTPPALVPVIVAEDPLTCVVRGSGMALERMDKLGGIFTNE